MGASQAGLEASEGASMMSEMARVCIASAMLLPALMEARTSEDEPVILDRFSPVLHLIQTIRDEAHRFAVTFHRSRRESKRLVSELDEAPGVGPKTVQKLLRDFGSAERVRAASEDELAASVGRAAARRVRSHYTDQADEYGAETR